LKRTKLNTIIRSRRSLHLFQLRPRLPGIPALLKLRLGLTGRFAFRLIPRDQRPSGLPQLKSHEPRPSLSQTMPIRSRPHALCPPDTTERTRLQHGDVATTASVSGRVFIPDQSASGKRDSSAQRHTAQNCLQARNGLRGDRNAAARARQLRAPWPSPGNLQVRKTAWWWIASELEPVSAQNSLLAVREFFEKRASEGSRLKR
jgi:hypothetical protein